MTHSHDQIVAETVAAISTKLRQMGDAIPQDPGNGFDDPPSTSPMAYALYSAADKIEGDWKAHLPAGGEATANRGFHWRDGWYFKRLEGGRVQVLSPNDQAVIPPSEWASVISSVSDRDNETGWWTEARKFHGDPALDRYQAALPRAGVQGSKLEEAYRQVFQFWEVALHRVPMLKWPRTAEPPEQIQFDGVEYQRLTVPRPAGGDTKVPEPSEAEDDYTVIVKVARAIDDGFIRMSRVLDPGQAIDLARIAVRAAYAVRQTLADAHEESVRKSERERCAKIADDFARPIIPDTTAGAATQMTGEAIAAAIRSRDEHRAAR